MKTSLDGELIISLIESDIDKLFELNRMLTEIKTEKYCRNFKTNNQIKLYSVFVGVLLHAFHNNTNLKQMSRKEMGKIVNKLLNKLNTLLKKEFKWDYDELKEQLKKGE